MTYWEVLGVAPDATDEQIKAAYRKLAQRYHPDRESGNPQKFSELQEAYAVLGDPAARAAYINGTLEIHNIAHQIEAAAQRDLLIWFSQMLDKVDIYAIDAFDFRENMLTTIDQSILNLKGEMKKNKTQRAKLRKVKRKFSASTPVFIDLIRQQRSQLILNYKRFCIAKKVSRRSREIAETIEYETIAVQQLYFSTGTSTGYTGSTF